MLQTAQSAEVATPNASLAMRISMVFAAHVVEGIERTASNREVVDAVLRIQEDMRAICYDCNERWPISIISRAYARRVCNLARSVPFDELVQELRRRFNDQFPRCPRCGCRVAASGEETQD